MPWTTMGFVHVAVAALCVLSVGQSAPATSCETLTQRIDIQGTDQLLGAWTYVAETTDVPGGKLLTKMLVENNWANVTAANETNTINVFQVQKMFGRCFSLTMKMTLENNTLNMSHPYEATEILLKTSCPDCLVVLVKITAGANIYSRLKLMSRRNKLTTVEVAEFKKQAQCLNLPRPVIMDPEKDLCPEGSVSQEPESTDLTNAFNPEMVGEVFKVLDKITNNEGNLQEFVKMISSDILSATEN